MEDYGGKKYNATRKHITSLRKKFNVFVEEQYDIFENIAKVYGKEVLLCRRDTLPIFFDCLAQVSNENICTQRNISDYQLRLLIKEWCFHLNIARKEHIIYPFLIFLRSIKYLIVRKAQRKPENNF